MKILKTPRMEYSGYDKVLNILDVLIIGNIVYSFLKQVLNQNPLIHVGIVIAVAGCIFYFLRTLYIGHVLNIFFSGLYAMAFIYILPIEIIARDKFIIKVLAWLILYILCLCIRFDCSPIGLLQKPYTGLKINFKECRLNWNCWNYKRLYKDYGYNYSSTDSTNNQNSNHQYYESNEQSYQTYQQPQRFESDFFKDCSSKEELDKKYKFLIKHFHPDQKNGDEAMFKLVQEHYDKLKSMYE